MQLKLAHPYDTITEFMTLYNSNYELQDILIIIIIMISYSVVITRQGSDVHVGLYIIFYIVILFNADTCAFCVLCMPVQYY